MGERLKVIVAEDEELVRRRLVRLLQEAGCTVLEIFPDGRGVAAWAEAHPEVDALFLDIHMPGLDGFALLETLGSRFHIVLVTAYAEHAVAAYDHDAVDYLLKPVTASRMERALRRIEARRGHAAPAPPTPARPSRYPVQAGEGVVLVDLARTTHFEVDEEGVWAHAGTRMRTQWRALAEVEAAFPHAGLLRIHRHLLVRPEAVIGLKPSAGGRVFVRLTGGVEVEASRGGAPRLRERLGV